MVDVGDNFSFLLIEIFFQWFGKWLEKQRVKKWLEKHKTLEDWKK